MLFYLATPRPRRAASFALVAGALFCRQGICHPRYSAAAPPLDLQYRGAGFSPLRLPPRIIWNLCTLSPNSGASTIAFTTNVHQRRRTPFAPRLTLCRRKCHPSDPPKARHLCRSPQARPPRAKSPTDVRHNSQPHFHHLPQAQMFKRGAGAASPHAHTFARRHRVAHAFSPLAKSRP